MLNGMRSDFMDIDDTETGRSEGRSAIPVHEPPGGPWLEPPLSERRRYAVRTDYYGPRWSPNQQTTRWLHLWAYDVRDAIQMVDLELSKTSPRQTNISAVEPWAEIEHGEWKGGR